MSPLNFAFLPRISLSRAFSAPSTSPRMVTFDASSSAFTLAPAATSMLPVTRNSPSARPSTVMWPSYVNLPSRLSFGPIVNFLSPSRLASSAAPTGVLCEAASCTSMNSNPPRLDLGSGRAEARDFRVLQDASLLLHIGAENLNFVARQLTVAQLPCDLTRTLPADRRR